MNARFGAAVLAASLLSASAPASAYTTLFAFGDSLSDAGNLFYLDKGTAPVSPYVGGHFSNGPTWVEDLSVTLGLGQLLPSYRYGYYGHDFAVAGAQTGPTAIEVAYNPADLLGQVATYGVLHPTPVAGALYTLDIGGNDIMNALSDYGLANINGVSRVVSQAETNTVDALYALRFTWGARNLLFYEVPDLGLTPRFRGTPLQPWASFFASSFDAAVLHALHNLEPYGLKDYDLDTYDLLDNAKAFGFSNVTDPCWTGSFSATSPCQNPDSYVFWDRVHPTAAAHLLTAEIADGLLTPHLLTANFAFDTPTAVPEPSTWAMMLLGFAGLGYAACRSGRKSRIAAAA